MPTNHVPEIFASKRHSQRSTCFVPNWNKTPAGLIGSSGWSSRSPLRSPARSPARSHARSPSRSTARSPSRSTARTSSDARSPARMYGGNPIRNVVISFVGTNSKSWKSDNYAPPHNFTAEFECINLEKIGKFGVFCDYKSTKPLGGKDWYLKNLYQGTAREWAMFARTEGEHWGHHHPYVGVKAGYPAGDVLSSHTGNEFPKATQWWDRINGMISVDIAYVD
jgi:hypothetical protein